MDVHTIERLGGPGPTGVLLTLRRLVITSEGLPKSVTRVKGITLGGPFLNVRVVTVQIARLTNG